MPHAACVYLICTVAPANSVRLPSLLYWRVQRGLTQEQLAERIAMRRSTVGRIEGGRPALVRTARSLAKALCVAVNDLQRQPSKS
jgi:transcriptional regulator with XRE-family HTH domain